MGSSQVAGSHKPVVQAFRTALWVYDRRESLESQDHDQRWAKKVEEYRKKIEANYPEYQREER